MDKRVLVVDGGGRGHGLAKALAESPGVGKVFVAPGNGGTAMFAENWPIATTAIDELLDRAEINGVDLIVGGDEAGPCAGLADCARARGRGIPVFAPTASAAILEGSKIFTKRLARRRGIATAPFEFFTSGKQAWDHLIKGGTGATFRSTMIKYDGLAAGKGAMFGRTVDEAAAAVRALLDERQFGTAGAVIEDFLGEGRMPEVSFHFFVDSNGHIAECPPISDHKKNHLGQQTGGVGTISDTPWITAELKSQALGVAKEIVAEMRRLGRPFMGMLYPGFMLTKVDGQWVLQLLEVNVRFGDSECQTLLKRLNTDLLQVILACINGTLPDLKIEWSQEQSACIILYADGYPNKAVHGNGQEITGIEIAEKKVPGVTVYHAGTKIDESGKLATSGGRVLGVTAKGQTLQGAINNAYEAARYISFKGKTMREDIGEDALTFKLE